MAAELIGLTLWLTSETFLVAGSIRQSLANLLHLSIGFSQIQAR